MSKNDMVMVPREVAEAAWQALDDDGRFEEPCPLREALDKPDEQHQALLDELAELEIEGGYPSSDEPDAHDEWLDTNASTAIWLLGNLPRIQATLATEQHQGEPLPITRDMNRLMEACRIGEFKDEGGSETVEALAVASLDAKSSMGHDADSYMAGYSAALYEQVEPFIWMSLSSQFQRDPVAWRGINELGEVVTEWIDGSPPPSMVDLCGKPASFAKIELAYTNADPAEVERLRRFEAAYLEWSNKTDWVQQTAAPKELGMHRADVIKQRFDTLRAQLAERDALLVDIRLSGLDESRMQRLDSMLCTGAYAKAIDKHPLQRTDIDRTAIAAISGSAEPSAPTPLPAYMEAVCDKFDWTPEEALRFYAEGKHFDTDNGRTRILCTGSIASHALKGMSVEYAELKGSEPSAPVEIDEQVEFMAWANKEYGVGPDEELNLKNPNVRDNKIGWLARAALGHKP